MKRKRFIGYDLNGRRDLAARSWLIKPGAEEELEGEFIVSGGLNGTVVRVDEDGRERYVGGALARLAPQGRGRGWGEVGAADKRVSTYELVREAERYSLELPFALSALGAGADVAVASMDDVKDIREVQQESLLKAMRDVRNCRCLHVWRPVLAVLSALENRSLEESAVSIAVVSQTAEGVATQRLIIRKTEVLAPERRQVGQLHQCDLGFNQLLEQARSLVESQIPVRTRKEELRHLEMPIRMTMGLEPASELYRSWNGRWVIVPEMLSPSLENDLLPEAVKDEIANVDVVLVETLAEGPVRSHFASLIGKISDREPVVLASNSVARGALIAARRLFRGETVYFDFLPQISTIVQDGQGPKNFDLIPPSATLPAGKTYRSEVPANLGLQSGQDQITVYLKKELEDRPRKAVLSLPRKSESIQEIRCLVEQAPAQGRAWIMLESDLFQAPMTVDWDGAEEIKKDWEAVLKDLKTPPPKIPSRLVLPSTYELWRDRPNRKGLSTLLREAQSLRQPNWKILADKLSSREGSAFCVSSDGDLPAETSAEERELLAKLQKSALKYTLERAKGILVEDNNDALRFLTWLFKRCDAEVIPEMLKALDASKGEHPFRYHHANQRLIYQGLGRVLSDSVAIRRVLDHLIAIDDIEWNSMDHIACAAFLLARTDDAPKLLERVEVERLALIGAEKLCHSIREGKYSATLHYPPFLFVGLLRWRLVNNSALVAGIDKTADIMLKAVDYALPRLEREAIKKENLRRFHKVLSDVRKELKGEGSNPDILRDLVTL